MKEKIEELVRKQKRIPGQLSIAGEMKQYRQMLDSGIITQEEFELKKKQLLGL